MQEAAGRKGWHDRNHEKWSQGIERKVQRLRHCSLQDAGQIA